MYTVHGSCSSTKSSRCTCATGVSRSNRSVMNLSTFCRCRGSGSRAHLTKALKSCSYSRTRSASSSSRLRLKDASRPARSLSPTCCGVSCPPKMTLLIFSNILGSRYWSVSRIAPHAFLPNTLRARRGMSSRSSGMSCRLMRTPVRYLGLSSRMASMRRPTKKASGLPSSGPQYASSPCISLTRKRFARRCASCRRLSARLRRAPSSSWPAASATSMANSPVRERMVMFVSHCRSISATSRRLYRHA
mmetsp:Transcript_9656/g.33950  ORF Transcript_9656/g.33950 Transcript_9656/m.33950 type:complete len:247 (-) Transcript_9656:429-1169(-)